VTSARRSSVERAVGGEHLKGEGDRRSAADEASDQLVGEIEVDDRALGRHLAEALGHAG
jgi:hypothetical protein